MKELGKINLFFLSKGNYKRCIVTTKNKIKESCWKKITLELETAKKWVNGFLVSKIGTVEVYDPKIYNNRKYFFIKVHTWYKTYDRFVYMAIEKKVANGKKYSTENLKQTLAGSLCNVFLFEEKPA
jgi:hypothetical protein